MKLTRFMSGKKEMFVRGRKKGRKEEKEGNCEITQECVKFLNFLTHKFSFCNLIRVSSFLIKNLHYVQVMRFIS